MAGTARRHDWTLRLTQPNPHCSNHMTLQKLCGKAQAPGPACTIPSLRGRTRANPLGAQRKVRQHSDYSNCSIHTLHTAEIIQQANGGREEEARASTLCMAWHAQQETSSCATIPTDTGRRGHPASTTALPPEAWPSECNTNNAKQPKGDKVFLNTTHC